MATTIHVRNRVNGKTGHMTPEQLAVFAHVLEPVEVETEPDFVAIDESPDELPTPTRLNRKGK